VLLLLLIGRCDDSCRYVTVRVGQDVIGWLLLLANRCVVRLLDSCVGGVGRAPVVGVPADVLGKMVGSGEGVVAHRAGVNVIKPCLLGC